MYQDLTQVLNTVICGSSELMKELPDESIHLVITSPPYNVGKDYEQNMPFEAWQLLMERVFFEVRRVLVPGGRVCINIAGTGRTPYIPMQHHLTGVMLDLGYLMRGEVIWDKGASAGCSSAWGSWKSATNPVLRDIHEYILIYSKDKMGRVKTADNTIERDEFIECTKSIWKFPTESKKSLHPCPFPVELPRRLINLYSFKDDVVLDPFAGSGTTCVAAIQTGRNYIGYEDEPKYHEIAISRIKEIQSEDVA